MNNLKDFKIDEGAEVKLEELDDFKLRADEKKFFADIINNPGGKIRDQFILGITKPLLELTGRILNGTKISDGALDFLVIFRIHYTSPNQV